MPYDPRSANSHHVQDTHHRQRSRRRIAAVSFLSNISFDGTHNDTNLHCVSTKNFRSSILDSTDAISDHNIADVIKNEYYKEPLIPMLPVRKLTLPSKPNTYCDEEVNITENNNSFEPMNDESDNKLIKLTTLKIHNPNALVTLGSFDKELSVNKVKKLPSNIFIGERPSYAKNVINKVKSLRSKTIAASIEKENLSIIWNEKDRVSQNSSKSSLNYLDSDRPSDLHGLGAAQSSKLSIDSVDSASIYPSNPKEIKQLRTAVLSSAQNISSSEHPRKRTSSGSRHLPTIADRTDSTVDLSSNLQTISTISHKPQEISYSHLLIQSSYFGSPLTAFGRPAQILSQSQHNAVSRCFSHDPNMHNQHPPAEVGRQSHPQVHTASTMCQSVSCTTGNLNMFSIPNYILSPEILDDPLLKSGKHRKPFEFCSYIASIVEFAKPDECKREMNENFRKKFPQVRITLSKLRSLKREMVFIIRSAFGAFLTNVPTLTLCYAHAYFDCLCLNGKVDKSNRKALSGACLIISAKMNDIKGEELEDFVEKIENSFRVDRCDLVTNEMMGLLALQFNIHLPIGHINSHLQRLLFEQ